MAVISIIKTNATKEEILDAIHNYNSDVYYHPGENMHRVYMASFDRYHLSCENANECLVDNLSYIFEKAGKVLEFEIIETELE